MAYYRGTVIDHTRTLHYCGTARILDRIACAQCIDEDLSYTYSVVCVCVCACVEKKTAQPIERNAVCIRTDSRWPKQPRIRPGPESRDTT